MAWKVAQPQDAMLRGKWWEIFNDPELNGLEEQAEHQQSEHQAIFRKFHGGARAGCAGAFATLPHDRNDSFVFHGRNPLAISEIRTPTNGTGGGWSHTTAGKQSSLFTLPATFPGPLICGAGFAARFMPRNTMRK